MRELRILIGYKLATWAMGVLPDDDPLGRSIAGAIIAANKVHTLEELERQVREQYRRTDPL